MSNRLLPIRRPDGSIAYLCKGDKFKHVTFGRCEARSVYMHSEGVLVIKFNILEPGFMRTVVQRVDQFTHLLVMNGLGSLF